MRFEKTLDKTNNVCYTISKEAKVKISWGMKMYNITRTGVGLFTLQFSLIFLKVLGILQIGWLWVYTPLWLPILIVLSIYLILLLVCGLGSVLFPLFITVFFKLTKKGFLDDDKQKTQKVEVLENNTEKEI